MRNRQKQTYLVAILTLVALCSAPEMATGAKGHPVQVAVQSQQDTSKPTENQPAPNKPSREPGAQQNQTEPNKTNPQETPQSSPEKQSPAEPAPAAPPKSQPGSEPSTTVPGVTQSPPQTATPEKQEGGAPASQAPGATPAQANTSSHSKTPHSSRKNGTNRNARRPKIVVREGGMTETSALLAPSMTSEQASHQRENTAKLLASAELNLQKIVGRKLNSNQQAMVDQVHSYMQQAKDALNRGDLQRGHNLALKADLLSDDLVRH